jgi:chromosome segregation ATPase
MTPETTPHAGLHPAIVLSAYIEPLLRGRRVALFGDATIGLAEELGKRGARLVHAYDPDQTRAAEAIARAAPGSQGAVTFGVLTPDLGVRDGAFDVIVVPDLSSFPDPADILRRARRILGPAGSAVIATPNLRGAARRLLLEPNPPTRSDAPPGYYELYDLVSLQFPKVRMVGQAPFVGYTVADFAPRGEPEVSVDTSFLPTSEEPEHFIAIASDRALSIDAYTVVALPWAQVGGALAGEAEADTKREEERLALTETRARLALMGAELEKLRDRQQADARDAEARAQSATALSARLVELELALKERDGRLRELEGRSGDNHVRAERLSHQIRDLEEELSRQRDRATRLSKQLDDEKKARTKAELELGMIRGVPQGNPRDRDRIEALSAELEATRVRVAELEQEQTATQRRERLAAPASLSEASAVADLKLRHRVNELETTAANALREVTAVTAARDAALRDLAAATAGRDATVRDLAAAVAQREAAQRDLAAATAGRDATVRDLAAAVAQREAAQRDAAGAAATREAALRDGAAAVTARDTALERLREMEERAERANELEVSLTASQRSKEALAEKHQASESRRDAAERRAAAAERELAETRARVLELDQILVGSRGKLAEAEQRHREDREKVGELERRAEAAERALRERERGVSELAEARVALDEANAEIRALEAALRDRGRAVSALKRDLQESERIGKELLHEVDAARGESDTSAASTGGGEIDALRARLDALAESAARAEADLQASRWRVTRLELELAESSSASAIAPNAVQVELEAALAAARDEIAALRRAMGS